MHRLRSLQRQHNRAPTPPCALQRIPAGRQDILHSTARNCDIHHISALLLPSLTDACHHGTMEDLTAPRNTHDHRTREFIATGRTALSRRATVQHDAMIAPTAPDRNAPLARREAAGPKPAGAIGGTS